MNLLEYCCAHRGIFIYGAGYKGKMIYKILKKAGVSIRGFVVSTIDGDVEIDGFPIMEFQDWKMRLLEDDGCGIVVAVSVEHLKAIEENLSKSQISDWIYAGAEDIIQELYRENFPVNEKNFTQSISPLSRIFGIDRGTSICRYYIEKFLSAEVRHMNHVTYVTEVGENLYCKKYFGDVECDVIRYDKGTDLTDLNTLNRETYDLFICTQVFNFIYDVKKAIKGARYLLKSDGILLASVAGNISPISQADMDNYGHFWGFTYLGIERLVEEVFGKGKVKVMPFGNVLSATAYTQGLCLEDITDVKLLDYNDANYAIVIGIVAHK